MTEQPSRTERRRVRQSTTPLEVAWVLGGLLLAYRVWQLSRSYFWQDDFLYLAYADTHRLTLEGLLRDYNGHLMPGAFLAAEAVASTPFPRWLSAAAIVLAMTAVALWLNVRVMFEIFGKRWATLLPIVVLMYSPLWVTPTLWWAAALQSLPLQISLLGAIWGGHRYLKRQRGAGMTIGTCAFAFGLVFWEKSLIVPVAAVLVLSLIRSTSSNTRYFHAFASVVRQLGLLAVVWAATGVAYLVFFLSRVDLDRQMSSDAVTAQDRAQAFMYTLTTFLTGMVGGPWRSTEGIDTLTPSPSGQAVFIAVQLVILTMGITLAFAGRRNWLQAAGVTLFIVAVDAAAVAWTRLDFLGPRQATDPRYFTESIVVAAMALGTLMLMTPIPKPSGMLTHIAARPRVVLGVTIFAFLNGALITQQALTDVADRRPARDWVTEAQRSLARTGGIIAFDGPVPGQIVSDLFVDKARASTVLSDPGLGISWNSSTADLRMFDGQGTPREATIVDITTDAGSGPTPDCGWPLETTSPQLVEFAPVTLGSQVLTIGYYTNRPAEIAVTAGGIRQVVIVPEGLHRLFLFDVKEADSVHMELLQGGTVCVTQVQAGKPWPKE